MWTVEMLVHAAGNWKKMNYYIVFLQCARWVVRSRELWPCVNVGTGAMASVVSLRIIDHRSFLPSFLPNDPAVFLLATTGRLKAS